MIKNILAFTLIGVGASLHAATIDFDPPTVNWQTDFDTPEVDVVFQTTFASYIGGYNDLSWLAIINDATATGVIDFIPVAGSQVTLNSFDLGNYVGNERLTRYSIFDLADTARPIYS